MPHGHGLVRQHVPINGDALGTLGARIALSLNTVMSSITSSFLMLRYKMLVQLTGRTVPDNGPLVIVLARGDATLAEIQSAFQEQNTAGPEDLTQTLSQDNIKAIYEQTVQPFVLKGDGTEGQILTPWIRLGRGGKGIPALETVGFSAFVFNTGSGALTTGSSVDGSIWVEGKWLRD